MAYDDFLDIDDDDGIYESPSDIRLREITEGLTENQLKAVLHRDAPLVILAGAGTGKTHTLTARIAHLIISGDAKPEEILAVTFTNKAAKEMASRIKRNLNDDLNGLTVGTFHAICANMLRENYELFGVKQDYVIMDSDDQKRMIRRLAKSTYGKNVEKEIIEDALSFIEEIRGNPLEKEEIINKTNINIYNLYALYEKTKNEDGVLDFTDLISIVTEAFYNNIVDPEIFSSKWKYILVDEYQDTNGLQFMWLQQIVNNNPNLTVVGDDDQVLYSWRGARIENILEFENQFDNTEVIRLEKNFRSTGHILDAANGLIKHNKTRLGKTLYTDDIQGEKVIIHDFFNAEDEAEWITNKIKDSIKSGVKPNEIAVLTRASHALNLLEQKLTFGGIPYVLSGGRRFQDKAEIRDAMAYLRMAANPNDSSAFERIVNVPKRGMGDVAIKKIIEATEKAREFKTDMSLLDIAKNHTVGKTLNGNVPEKLKEFVQTIAKANKLFWRNGNAADILKLILQESGYIEDLKRQSVEAKESGDNPMCESIEIRLNNLNDLLTIGSDKQPLELVEHLGLTEDGKATKKDGVWVGTIHAAKGLEWPIVIGAAWEDNILPSWQAIDEGGNAADEERRCAYVLITRARKELHLTHTSERFQKAAERSRFIGQIPDENKVTIEH